MTTVPQHPSAKHSGNRAETRTLEHHSPMSVRLGKGHSPSVGQE